MFLLRRTVKCFTLHLNYVKHNSLLKAWHRFSDLSCVQDSNCSPSLSVSFFLSVSGITTAMDDYTKIEKIGEGKYGEQ